MMLQQLERNILFVSSLTYLILFFLTAQGIQSTCVLIQLDSAIVRW